MAADQHDHDRDQDPTGAAERRCDREAADEAPGPLEGLMDPEEGEHEPASEADAPAPFG